jgi:hypothetical protein
MSLLGERLGFPPLQQAASFKLKKIPISAIGSAMPISPIKRRRFSRDLVLVLLLLSGAVLGSVAFFSLRAHEDISQQYIDNATARAARQFETMVVSVIRDLELAGDWAASGRLSPGNESELNGLLFPYPKWPLQRSTAGQQNRVLYSGKKQMIVN